jgi:hypothetical protein
MAHLSMRCFIVLMRVIFGASLIFAESAEIKAIPHALLKVTFSLPLGRLASGPRGQVAKVIKLFSGSCWRVPTKVSNSLPLLFLLQMQAFVDQ